MSSLRGKVAIVGAADTEVGKVPHMSATQLCIDAARRALDDAGISKDAVDGLVTCNSMAEPHMYHAEAMAEYLQIFPKYCVSAGAGGGTTFAVLYQAAAAMGAGFVCKDDSLETLAGAIRAAAEGRPTYSASVAARLPRDAASLRSAGSALTRREQEVLCHIARGLAKRDVADRLEISVRTVETHVRNLMEKVGVNDRVGLARYAIREGYVEP